MPEQIRTDIDAAVKKMTVKFGGGREIKRLADHLWDGETVKVLGTGQYGGGMGLLMLSDRRLLFLKDGMMKQSSEDFPLDKISSIQWSSGVLSGKIQVFVSGNKTEIANVAKAEGKEIVDTVRGHIAGSGATSDQAPAAPAPNVDDSIAQLERLAALRDQGILTDEEFAAKKAQVLGL